MQKILYIFIHGETDWNKEGKMQYWTDIELNETGLQQATKNAEILKDKNIQQQKQISRLSIYHYKNSLT